MVNARAFRRIPVGNDHLIDSDYFGFKISDCKKKIWEMKGKERKEEKRIGRKLKKLFSACIPVFFITVVSPLKCIKCGLEDIEFQMLIVQHKLIFGCAQFV